MEYVEWRDVVRAGLSEVQHSLTPIYENTRRFGSYTSWLISGLLQTPAYAEQILREARRQHGLEVDDVAAAVAERIDRQRLLADPDRKFAFVIEEWVLRHGYGGADVMRDQLHHLASIDGPNISLGVIPARPDRQYWPAEGFTVFDDARVDIELISGSLTVTQPRDVATYARTFAELASIAVYGAEARTLITAAIDSL